MLNGVSPHPPDGGEPPSYYPLEVPLFWLFSNQETQDAVLAFIWHWHDPRKYRQPDDQETERFKTYLFEWLEPFEHLETLKERLPLAQTPTELRRMVDIMAQAGADPL